MDDSPPQPRTVLEVMRASHLKEVIQEYGDALRARRKGIDKLNVYPVPDGDTGTNMSLTVESVVAELKDAATDDMQSISAAISKGAIMGARGNSGAILAQALRGVAESVKEKSDIGPADLSEALERARKSAYDSVLKPVEGTILTVLSAAADAAKTSAGEGHKLGEQLGHVRQASAEALARTPDLLPVLKHAGVVDAGGSGFLLFVDALRYVVTGEPVPSIVDALNDADGPDLSEAHGEISDLRYEVMFLLDADDANVPAFRDAWGHLGDSIVVVGGDGMWNCHIHTDEIGAAIEAAISFGKPHQIRVTDLLEQAGVVAREAGSNSSHIPATPGESVETAVVGVVNGKGVERIYRSFGVQELVTGGQTMNPSVAELLNAVETAPSANVIILPNNKNIHTAAQQVNDLSEKSVRVVPTTSVVEGMSALIAYDPGVELAQNFEQMQATSSGVVCGEITRAVRDSTCDAGPIKKDDWIGIGPNGICVIATSLTDAVCRLLDALCNDRHEVVTLLEGDGSLPEVTIAAREWLQQNRPSIELEVHAGGQPLYPYLLGVE